MSDPLFSRAAQVLANASALVCLTGAGASAESGVPTFRDARTGLWSRYDPEELASPAGFARNPGLVWRWYMWRLALVEGARPNAGHVALARLETRTPCLTLITQNVDSLHEAAGNGNVLHLHGHLDRFRCHRCRTPYVLQEPDRRAQRPPVCPHCGAWIRPDVVWFGEALPPAVLEAAWRAVERCDVMLVVGTSGMVTPAAQLPRIAKRAGAEIIDVDPQPGPLSALAHLFLPGRSSEILPRLLGTDDGST